MQEKQELYIFATNLVTLLKHLLCRSDIKFTVSVTFTDPYTPQQAQRQHPSSSQFFTRTALKVAHHRGFPFSGTLFALHWGCMVFTDLAKRPAMRSGRSRRQYCCSRNTPGDLLDGCVIVKFGALQDKAGGDSPVSTVGNIQKCAMRLHHHLPIG